MDIIHGIMMMAVDIYMLILFRQLGFCSTSLNEQQQPVPYSGENPKPEGWIASQGYFNRGAMGR